MSSHKGKAEPVVIHEIYDTDPPEIQEKKAATAHRFQEAWHLFQQQSFPQAQGLFEECAAQNPLDPAIQVYLDRCAQMIRQGVDAAWTGVFKFETKDGRSP